MTNVRYSNLFTISFAPHPDQIPFSVYNTSEPGTFSVDFITYSTGYFNVSVTANGTSLRGSPFPFRILSGIYIYLPIKISILLKIELLIIFPDMGVSKVFC